jgi:hypothetical protein
MAPRLFRAGRREEQARDRARMVVASQERDLSAVIEAGAAKEHSFRPALRRSMEEKPSPATQRALRQAQLYGCLVARNDRLYHPGGNKPVCSLNAARDMNRSGWLIARDDRFEITPEVPLALEAG